jgi:hypothetical protein
MLSFAVHSVLLLSTSLAYVAQADNESKECPCNIKKFAQQTQAGNCNIPVGPPSNIGQYLSMYTSHVCVITGSDAESATQINTWRSIGFGDWLNPAIPFIATGSYCGETSNINATLTFTTNEFTWAQGAPNYYEVIQLVDKKQKNIFSDFYDVHGPSLLYYGMVPANSNVTFSQIRQFLADEQIPIIFSLNIPGAIIVDWIRIGYAYAELVYNEVTLP